MRPTTTVTAAKVSRSRFRAKSQARLSTPSVLLQKSLQWWIRDFACIVRDGRRCDHRHNFEQVLFFKTGFQKGGSIVVGQLAPLFDQLLGQSGKGGVAFLFR